MKPALPPGCTLHFGDMRLRMVKYSPSYLANHWCERVRALLVLEGELTSELQDGRRFVMTEGMSY